MSKLMFSFVTVLPDIVDITPHTVYLLPSATTGYVDLYVTNLAGTEIKHVNNIADTNAAITTAINAAIGGLQVVEAVANLSGLTTLSTANATKPIIAYVADPRAGTANISGVSITGDTTVATGYATYLWVPSTTTWIKVGEGESMDLILDWANIQNKPTSSVAAIDQAVADSHTHANKAVLDLFTENVDGDVLYDGVVLQQVVVGNTEW